MRNVGVCLLTLCLLMTAGCKSPPKPGTTTGGGTDRPFMPRSEGTSSTLESISTPSNIDGLLAGQVVDKFNRRIPEASIQVVDVQELTTSSKAALEVTTDKQGYFTIQGLKVGHTYRLNARIAEGKRLLSGTTLATPPNPRLSIYVSEDYTTPSTPPPPDPPGAPDKKGAEKEKTSTTPQASLDPPKVTAPDTKTQPSTGATAAPIDKPIDKSQIASEGGFEKGPKIPGIPFSDRVSMPGAGTIEQPKTIPPPPGSPKLETPARPATVSPTTTTEPGPTASLPQAPVGVPSCVLVGDQLHNFALYDLDGQPWEYRRHKTGRLVLLNFWQNANSLPLVPHLVKMQADYKAAGLEVIGIAYEPGTEEQQRLVVRGTRVRFGINYKLLLGGGPIDSCPVGVAFSPERLPGLVMLNDKGKIVWRSKETIDERQLKELRVLIAQGLDVRER